MSARSARLGSVCLCFLWMIGVAGAAEPGAKSAAKSATQERRTWVDTTGKFRVRAQLVDVQDGNVRLKKLDGSVISVPIEKLSQADQDWLAKQSGSAPAPSEAAAGGANWPGFRGLNHDGKSPDKGLLKEWPQAGPKLLWKADGLGKGWSGVAVAGGTVYITGEPDDKLFIYAFDLDGKPKWKVEHGPAWTRDHPGARATPTIDGGNLYLLSGTGLLGCYDAKSGDRKWVKDAKQFGGSPGG